MTSIAQRLREWGLDVAWRTSSKPKDPAERAEMLRSLLRRYPRWSNGHKILAEERLEYDDVAQAYAASRCYQALIGSNQRKRAYANLLLAKCYLRRGDWQSAQAVLKSALEDDPHSTSILEELAAAQILGGSYGDARSVLEQIRKGELSAQAKAALAFVRSKA
jgi:Flp pilus assembly protein TadD